MSDMNTQPSQPVMEEETRQYLESHPHVAVQLKRAQEVYQKFGEYLSLTQSRIIIRESNGSTAEADLNAPLLRTDR